MSASSAREVRLERRLRDALKDHGFLYLANHGIQDDILEGAAEAMRRFFALPLEEKSKLHTDFTRVHPRTSRGFILKEALNTSRGEDIKEVLDIGREGSEAALAIPFQGPNVWPATLPPEDFKLPILRHQEAMWDLACDMTRAIALSLALPETFFDQFVDDPIIIHRLNYYPAHLSPGPNHIACGEHTDYGFFTLLQQVGGSEDLEVHAGGQWVPVPAVPGMLNFNIGDLMDVWSNGLYRATLHRVITKQRCERGSLAFFFDPNYEAIVEPVPTSVSAESPQKYSKVQAGRRKLAKYEAVWRELDKTAKLEEGEGVWLFRQAD
uniref:Fe2OG dioxygenase domain-containing protein n=1 Tax=Pyrodinium bahamense TaxID=73915 RepID=A0A7S0FIB5_9DINO|mmetsp:Transcript_343/g.869  ORF Transcript_343/g.869 Transcript_343/m.869 type:complete len:323 (+) Transcript_343:44-1012(+)